MTPAPAKREKIFTWICRGCRGPNAETVPFTTRGGDALTVTCRQCGWSTRLTIAAGRLSPERRERARLRPPI